MVRVALTAAFAWLAVCAAQAGTQPAAAGTEIEAALRQALLEQNAVIRIDPRHLDVERVARDAARRMSRVPNDDDLRDWARFELYRAKLSFAPVSPRHDDQVRYRLPFELQEPRLCVQAVGGTYSHDDAANFHSFDFTMPEGTPILAAREGVVARIRDGSKMGGADESMRGRENEVLVLHADGTFALYLHLSAGVAVREDQKVARGQLIGRSGNSGISTGPHLHFAVMRVVREAEPETVPILFGVGSPKGFVPETGKFYGSTAKDFAPCEGLLAGAGPPPGASEALRGFFATFWEISCGIRINAGMDYFTKAEEAANRRLRVTATPGWLALEPAEERMPHVAMLHDLWSKANPAASVSVEIVDPAGKRFILWDGSKP
jgi:murein DD-endopeptidase MepM/ murein hydrolase activator NlpD